MVVISVQARMGSTRLPGKVLLELGDKRVIEHVVDRASGATSAADVVLTTGDRAPNDAIREWARRANVRCETGPEEDLLERHRRVAEVTGSNVLVRVTGDCPFVPPSEITRTLAVHSGNGANYTRNDWSPSADQAMPIGTAVDVFDVEFLARLTEAGATHPNRRPIESPDEYDVAFSPNPEWAEYDVHTAVDTPRDYWRLTDAVQEAGTAPREVAEWLAATDG